MNKTITKQARRPQTWVFSIMLATILGLWAYAVLPEAPVARAVTGPAGTDTLWLSSFRNDVAKAGVAYDPVTLRVEYIGGYTTAEAPPFLRVILNETDPPYREVSITVEPDEIIWFPVNSNKYKVIQEATTLPDEDPVFSIEGFQFTFVSADGP